jgi:hypothetical protein
MYKIKRKERSLKMANNINIENNKGQINISNGENSIKSVQTKKKIINDNGTIIEEIEMSSTTIGDKDE